MSASAAASAHPAEHPPEAGHAAPAEASHGPTAANDNAAVAHEQRNTAAKAKKATKPQPVESHDEPSHHEEDHGGGAAKSHGADEPPHAAPHATPAAAHPEDHADAGHHRKLLIPKWEGDGIKHVGKQAAKGAWTLAKFPVTFPIHLATGITYGVLGKFYDGAVWTKNGAKWLWNRDTLYIPTVTKFTAGVVAWPFVKLWQGTKWVGKGLWNNKTWPLRKAWDGTKWAGRKIKGIFVKPKPASAATPPAATPAAAATPPAATAHGTPAPATPPPAAAAAHPAPAPAHHP